jgi:hypothetical protein
MHHPEGGLPGFYFRFSGARGAKRVALLPYDFTSAGPLTPSDVELRAYASHVKGVAAQRGRIGQMT